MPATLSDWSNSDERSSAFRREGGGRAAAFTPLRSPEMSPNRSPIPRRDAYGCNRAVGDAGGVDASTTSPFAYDNRVPEFNVKVAASWDPKVPINPAEELFSTGEKFTQDPQLFKRLGDWISSPPRDWNASVTQDHNIGPARMTLEVLVAALDAPSEWDARIDACSLVREELQREGFPNPDTLIGTAQNG